MAAAEHMQSRLSTMGLMAQLAAQEAPMGPGVVQGVSDTTRSTRPRSRANQARVALIMGTRMKGRKNTGFMTMGAPNSMGSLILNSEGSSPSLPTDFRVRLRLRSAIHTRGSVLPVPPISRK